jgi:20S proteasome subunit alpha 4
LEKNHKDDLGRSETIKLTVKSLLEVVQTGAKNIEITVMESYGKQTVSTSNLVVRGCMLILFQSLALAEIEAIVSEIEKEKEQGACSAPTFPGSNDSLSCRGGKETRKARRHSC